MSIPMQTGLETKDVETKDAHECNMEWINSTSVRNHVLVYMILSMLRTMPRNEPMNDWKGESKVAM